MPLTNPETLTCDLVLVLPVTSSVTHSSLQSPPSREIHSLQRCLDLSSGRESNLRCLDLDCAVQQQVSSPTSLPQVRYEKVPVSPCSSTYRFWGGVWSEQRWSQMPALEVESPGTLRGRFSLPTPSCGTSARNLFPTDLPEGPAGHPGLRRSSPVARM